MAARLALVLVQAKSSSVKAAFPRVLEAFIATAQFMAANLLLRSGDSNAEIAEAFKALAPYLDR